MMTIQSIGIFSMGKMLGMTYACLGLIIGGIMSLVSLAAGAGAGGGGGGMQAMIFGVGAIILIPLIYGFAGFIGGLIFAVIYNVIAGMAGGIEIELVDQRGRRKSRGRGDEEW